MKAYIFFYLGLLLLITPNLIAQDYRFSQYYNSPLTLNPALTGNISSDYRLNMNYRNQWSSVSNAFKTFSGSVDLPMFEDVAGMSKMGLGLSFLSDKAGTTNYGFNNINLSLAYHTKSSRYTQLSAGLLLGYGNSSADLTNVKWESQHNGNNYDPSLGSGESAFVESINYLDAGLGLLWSHADPENDKLYEVGLSVMHVNFPNHSFINQYEDRLKPKIQLHGAMEIGYEGFSLKPKLLIQKQGPSYSFNIGALARFNLSDKAESKYTDAHVSSAFEIGAFYRYAESIVFVAQYDFKKTLQVALSYDINTSGIKTISSSGGYEISLIYQGLFKNNRIKIKNQMNKEKKDLPKKNPPKAKPNIRM